MRYVSGSAFPPDAMRALALVLLLLAPAARAQVAARLADLRLATAVRLALVDDLRTRALDLAVTAREGAVEVTGTVPPALVPTAAEVARSVRGVRQLRGLGSEAAGPSVRIETPRAEPRPAPRAAPASPAAGAVYHTVERGDTLFSLARRYDTTVDAIQALNDRSDTGIRVGQRLRVR